MFKANLTGAKLNGTNLQWAALTEVIPQDIDLTDAIISRTILPSSYSFDEDDELRSAISHDSFYEWLLTR
ncbi:pentapeptide repeat-containing protein [Scytonema sp. UIC 10036]|uniref:pentapeptide repeat-containing protein n=1 Tax=Scytonema sp. UIC 10036 TaxID=2304196 RepID=UPI00325AFEBF